MNAPTRRHVGGVPPVVGKAGGRKKPWLVLLIGLVSSVAVTWVYARLVESKDAERFENSVTQVTDTIRDRFTTYDAMLRGVVGLYTSGETVDAQDFERYVRELE